MSYCFERLCAPFKAQPSPNSNTLALMHHGETSNTYHKVWSLTFFKDANRKFIILIVTFLVVSYVQNCNLGHLYIKISVMFICLYQCWVGIGFKKKVNHLSLVLLDFFVQRPSTIIS